MKWRTAGEDLEMLQMLMLTNFENQRWRKSPASFRSIVIWMMFHSPSLIGFIRTFRQIWDKLLRHSIEML
jgi:hypothetical protein